MTDLVYFALGFAGLGALAVILAIIGKAASACPQIGAAARVGTLVITTGFIALGAGAVAIIGAFLPLLAEGRASGLYLALGFLSLALGLGFSGAAIRLRDILNAAPRPPAPEAAAMPAQ
ncbi:MAG: hypothetical protein AAFN27_08060 [Pseudomonadota bacterium]